jgi:hypothetical protein
MSRSLNIISGTTFTPSTADPPFVAEDFQGPDPPFVEAPPVKFMEESFKLSDPSVEDKYHELVNYFEKFRRLGLDPGMRFNWNPPQETWSSDDPPRVMTPPQATADSPFRENNHSALASILIPFGPAVSP